MIKLERIQELVEKAKTIPRSRIEYNGELPQVEGITADSFFGVQAVFNEKVPTQVGCNIIFSY